MRKSYRYEPKHVDEIVIRPFSFDFPDDLEPTWAADNRVRSHLFNGFSLTMPYLEPFLIKTMKEAASQIDAPELVEDIRGFNGQEAQHYKCHRRMNELLKKNGYPELAEVESRMDASWDRLSKRSLRTRLAYGAGFECMTNGFTNWFIGKRRQLFGGNDPHVSSFWLMHMVEETEHKTVAYDAYMACSGAYLPRAIGVFYGSFHVLGFGLLSMWKCLRKDGALRRPRDFVELARELGALLWNVGPYLLRALKPGHNPRCEGDPKWMRDWIAGHAELSADAPLPLVDTQHPDLPVPFAR